MSDPAGRGLIPGRPGRTLRAAAVLAVFLVLFILIDRLGGGPRPPRAAAPVTTAASATTTTAAPKPPPTTTTRGAAPATTTTRAPATTTTRAPATTKPPATTRPALRSAAGVTVQILNGTGALRAARNFKPEVRAAGYTIVNSGNAVGAFPVSTVYYTPGNRDDALSFQRRFPAFQRVAPAPGNLSSNVRLHVVIGDNFDS